MSEPGFCHYCGIMIDILEIEIEMDGELIQLCSPGCYHDFIDDRMDEDAANNGGDR